MTVPAVAGGPAWGYGPWVSPEGLTRQYFLLPAARRGHALWLAQQDNVFFPVTQTDFLGSVEWSAPGLYDPAARFEAWAQSGPGWFRLMDATTWEMAWETQTDLVVGQWGGAWFTSPVGGLTIYVEGDNLGHRFTLHGRVPGGSGLEFRQSLTVESCAPSSTAMPGR